MKVFLKFNGFILWLVFLIMRQARWWSANLLITFHLCHLLFLEINNIEKIVYNKSIFHLINSFS